MAENQENKYGPEALLETWLKQSAKFWADAAKAAPRSDAGKPGGETADEGKKSRFQETYDSTVRMWQVWTAMMAEPEAVEALTRGINALPDTAVKLMRPGIDSFFHLQKEWWARMGRIGESTKAYDFENLDREIFKVWSELYEKEFRQFFNLPQVGLTREYQERFTLAADKFNQFQAVMSEFVSLLYLPFERTAKVMQEKLSEMADEGALPSSARDYYRLWVKTLEGHYMTLFKSPEYLRTISKTLDALSEYAIARQKALEDALQALPVPTQGEMDELYKELYTLKKRLKQLEKQAKNGNGRFDG